MLVLESQTAQILNSFVFQINCPSTSCPSQAWAVEDKMNERHPTQKTLKDDGISSVLFKIKHTAGCTSLRLSPAWRTVRLLLKTKQNQPRHGSSHHSAGEGHREPSQTQRNTDIQNPVAGACLEPSIQEVKAGGQGQPRLYRESLANPNHQKEVLKKRK